jgi:hypothetical protein
VLSSCLPPNVEYKNNFFSGGDLTEFHRRLPLKAKTKTSPTSGKNNRGEQASSTSRGGTSQQIMPVRYLTRAEESDRATAQLHDGVHRRVFTQPRLKAAMPLRHTSCKGTAISLTQSAI